MPDPKPFEHSVDIRLTSGETGNADLDGIFQALYPNLEKLSDTQIDKLSLMLLIDLITRRPTSKTRVTAIKSQKE